METTEVLTPRSPRWQQFVDELSKAPICWRTTEHTRRVLEGMPGVDVEASLAALTALGGRCDCEILFDVAEWTGDSYSSERSGDGGRHA
jgi:hypothetical protein